MLGWLKQVINAQIRRVQAQNSSSAPKGAWEVKLEIRTDRQTDRVTDRQTTDMRGHREVLR